MLSVCLLSRDLGTCRQPSMEPAPIQWIPSVCLQDELVRKSLSALDFKAGRMNGAAIAGQRSAGEAYEKRCMEKDTVLYAIFRSRHPENT